jgi:hypothetical protein
VFVQNVSSVSRCMLQLFFYLDVAYVTTICSKCFSCFSLMLQQVVSCCNLQVFYFRCFTYFTHMLQKHIPNDSFIFILMLHSCYKCFMLFSLGLANGARGALGGPTDGGAGERWTEVLGWVDGCAAGQWRWGVVRSKWLEVGIVYLKNLQAH